VHETARPELVADERRSRRGWLSRYARGKKLTFFFDGLSQDASILDVGCGSGWLKRRAQARGWTGVVGIDLCPPADIVGDVVKWKDLGLEPHSFDVIVAFEVLEHGDLAPALLDLLNPTGS
jgi:2-polyprenyl-3-methyl-5-hydroxy-6-metoxy-1,4-benzoquinol methylase